MEIFKLIAFIFISIAVIFSLKRAFYALKNIKALKNYEQDPDPINQRHGMVFNKKTGKLEADQSPILPYE